MNSDQMLSALRTLIAVLSGVAIGHGWLTADQAATLGANVLAIVGALATLVPLLWGLKSHSDASKIAAVAAMPEVAKIVPSATAARDSAVVQAAFDPSQPKVVRS